MDYSVSILSPNLVLLFSPLHPQAAFSLITWRGGGGAGGGVSFRGPSQYLPAALPWLTLGPACLLASYSNPLFTSPLPKTTPPTPPTTRAISHRILRSQILTTLSPLPPTASPSFLSLQAPCSNDPQA